MKRDGHGLLWLTESVFLANPKEALDTLYDQQARLRVTVARGLDLLEISSQDPAAHNLDRLNQMAVRAANDRRASERRVEALMGTGWPCGERDWQGVITQHVDARLRLCAWLDAVEIYQREYAR
jgi:hypothetical protein